MKIRHRLFVFLQHLLPQHFLSSLMYRLARCEWTVWKNTFIRIFIWKFNVDMSLTDRQQARDFKHFNDFFTRSLKPDARPVAEGKMIITSPVDGVISQIGRINNDDILQVKGKSYSLDALLTKNNDLTRIFKNGKFMTIYLSPKDYHRIHMPVSGQLSKMIYVPGDLFSVNETTTEGVDDLFARNERVISLFQTELGTVALIMVGAIFVGSMETVWAGQITPATSRQIRNQDYDKSNSETNLAKGQEMGRFNMGSTVILLFEQGKCEWESKIVTGETLKMGQAVGAGNF